jgi:hypothetical protein
MVKQYYSDFFLLKHRFGPSCSSKLGKLISWNLIEGFIIFFPFSLIISLTIPKFEKNPKFTKFYFSSLLVVSYVFLFCFIIVYFSVNLYITNHPNNKFFGKSNKVFYSISPKSQISCMSSNPNSSQMSC